MVQVSKLSFEGGLCSDWNAFSRATGVRRVRSDSLPWYGHFYSKTVPTSYRTPKSVQNPPRTPVHYIYYYIDDANALFGMFQGFKKTTPYGCTWKLRLSPPSVRCVDRAFKTLTAIISVRQDFNWATGFPSSNLNPFESPPTWLQYNWRFVFEKGSKNVWKLENW